MTIVACPHGHWTPFECPKCQRATGERARKEVRDELLLEVAATVAIMADSNGIDVTKMRALMKRLKKWCG